MSAMTTVALTIEPEAQERLDELGLQAAFDQMIDHVRQAAPGLLRIEVSFPPEYDVGYRMVVIEATMAATDEEYETITEDWEQWYITLPPEVREHLVIGSYREESNGR